MNGDGSFDLAAEATDAAIQLHLVPQKQPVIHGQRGISQKAEGDGHASHYYSITRLATTGRVRAGKEEFAVTGESWFDHEWATNQLAPGQAGWNWISAQFDDQSELMLYQMRLTNGGIDPISSGTFLRADGSSVALTNADLDTRDCFGEKRKDEGQLSDWLADRASKRTTRIHAASHHTTRIALDPGIYWGLRPRSAMQQGQGSGW